MQGSPSSAALCSFAHKRAFDQKRKTQIDATLHRDLKHGWLLPYLIDIDELLWCRWQYWIEAREANKLPDRPIPGITFSHDGNHIEKSSGWRHISDCLELIDPYDGGSNMVELFLDWLLYGFGLHAQKTLPQGMSHETSMKLYQFFDLGILMAFPYDYWGEILSVRSFGQRLGFYPTPHPVVELMVRVGMMQHNITDTVLDPCLGTGRMLLHASNHCVQLYGIDINALVLKAALVNGYCYAPWMVKPFSFLDPESVFGDRQIEIGGEVMTISETIAKDMLEAAQANPKAAIYLKGAVYDKLLAPAFEPFKKFVIPDPPHQPFSHAKYLTEHQ